MSGQVFQKAQQAPVPPSSNTDVQFVSWHI